MNVLIIPPVLEKDAILGEFIYRNGQIINKRFKII